MLKTMKICTNLSKTITGVAQRQLSLSAVCTVDQKWRATKGLPENPNAFGPLTNLPDYTFLNGRPTPLGSNQKKRLIKQQEIAAKIVEFTGELEFAKKRFARLKENAETERQRILQNKLKPKGPLLLKQK